MEDDGYGMYLPESLLEIWLPICDGELSKGYQWVMEQMLAAHVERSLREMMLNDC